MRSCRHCPDIDRSEPYGEGPGQGYFHRISRLIERVILMFAVSLTLLGNYVAHRQLMSEVLLS